MPHNAKTKGRRAQEILEDEVFKEASVSAEHRLKEEWKMCQEPVQREALWHRINALDALPRELRILIENAARSAQENHDG